jgi:hypothetical protein
MADGLRRCAARRSKTSVTAGTIFAGTRTPLARWAPSETLASPVNAALSSSATGTRLTHDIAARTGEMNRAY